MGCQCGDAHRNEGAFSGRHRSDGGQELIRPGPIDDPQDRLPTLGQLEGALAAVLVLRPPLDEPALDQAIDEA